MLQQRIYSGKKGEISLNHLLRFTLAERAQPASAPVQRRYKPTHHRKETFVQAKYVHLVVYYSRPIVAALTYQRVETMQKIYETVTRLCNGQVLNKCIFLLIPHTCAQFALKSQLLRM